MSMPPTSTRLSAEGMSARPMRTQRLGDLVQHVPLQLGQARGHLGRPLLKVSLVLVAAVRALRVALRHGVRPHARRQLQLLCKRLRASGSQGP